MEIITPGHLYKLDSFEGGAGQTLQFIHKSQEKPDGDLYTVSDGTTNEEVLKMLIDRLKFLGNLLPCRENAIAITKLEEALLWLEKRTAERVARGVEGTHKP